MIFVATLVVSTFPFSALNQDHPCTERQLHLRGFVQAACTPGFLIYLGGYAVLLAWFKLVDVYHTQFATRGATVVVYNGFRVLFIFYLFWIVYFVGALTLRWAGRSAGLRTIERLVLYFFAGAGLWHIGLLWAPAI